MAGRKVGRETKGKQKSPVTSWLIMKQIFKCLKVKILYTINVSFSAIDTAKASNSPERFLYTNNFYIIQDPDFYFQRGQRLNLNCPFDGFLLLFLQWQLRHAQYWRGWSSGCQSSFFSEHLETACY